MVFTAFVGLVTLLITVLVLVIGLNRLAPLALSRWLCNALRRLAGLQAKTIHAQGLNFPHLVRGTGEPLVPVHGFTADKTPGARWRGTSRANTGLSHPTYPASAMPRATRPPTTASMRK